MREPKHFPRVYMLLRRDEEDDTDAFGASRIAEILQRHVAKPKVKNGPTERCGSELGPIDPTRSTA